MAGSGLEKMPEEMKCDRFMTDPPQGEACSVRVGPGFSKYVLEEVLGKAPPKGSLSRVCHFARKIYFPAGLEHCAVSKERLLRESLS